MQTLYVDGCLATVHDIHFVQDVWAYYAWLKNIAV